MTTKVGYQVIDSDAHVVEDIGKDFDQVRALARSCGYDEAMSFEGRRAAPLPLNQ